MLFKKLIAVFIAYSFLLQIGSSFGVWVNYMSHKDYAIAHCENKISKTMHCYGNCVLVKDIKALEKNQSKSNELTVKVQEFQLYMPISVSYVFQLVPVLTNFGLSTTKQYYSQYFVSIFNPPRLIECMPNYSF